MSLKRCCLVPNDFPNASAWYKARFNSEREEWTACAHFALTRALQGKSVRVVVPDLSSHRLLLEGIFSSVLHRFYSVTPNLAKPEPFGPLAQRTGEGWGEGQKNFCQKMAEFDSLRTKENKKPYVFLQPRALAQHPVVAGALALLCLVKKEQRLSEIADVVYTPFKCGHWQEMAARAEGLSEVVAGMSVETLPLQQWCDSFQQAEQFYQALQQVSQITVPTDATPTQFLSLFQTVWEIFSWQKTELLQEESAVLAAFDRALVKYAAQTTDPNLAKPEPSRPLAQRMGEGQKKFSQKMAEFDALRTISLNEALSLFVQGMQEPYQVVPEASQRIHIVDASHVQPAAVDAMWISGVNRGRFLSSCDSDSLLPDQLAKRYGIPHLSGLTLSSERQKFLSHVMECTAEGIFSVALTETESAEFPPFLQALPECRNITSPRTKPLQVPVFEAFADNQAPPIVGSIRGGTQVLKDQSWCPFRAFAKWRLRAKERSCVPFAIDPLLRGNLVHRALELLFTELQSQEKLVALPEKDCQDLVSRTIDVVLAEYGAIAIENNEEKKLPRHHQLFLLEKQRLQKILGDYLTIEAKRPHFLIHSLEAPLKASLSDLNFDMQVDRIDTISVGTLNGLLIIDYKTGQTTVQNWLGERPQEPQLPLYALFLKNIEAIAFLSINRKGIYYKGLSLHDTGIPGIKSMGDDFKSQCQEWQENLSNLARSFAQGDAQVNPESPQACHYCHLQRLCRIP